TDINGCVVVGSTTITEPTALVVNTTPTEVSCPAGTDGGVSSTVSGGTPTYNLSWSNGPTTTGITGLTSGSYTLTVTDGNGCTESSTSIVIEPAAFVVNMTSTDAGCKDVCNGTATVT